MKLPRNRYPHKAVECGLIRTRFLGFRGILGRLRAKQDQGQFPFGIYLGMTDFGWNRILEVGYVVFMVRLIGIALS